MPESTPKFNDARKATFGRPAFARDINAALSNAFDEWLDRPVDESPPPMRTPSGVILLGEGKPHPAIAGLTIDRAQVELVPRWNLSEEGDSLFADAKDDKLYRDEQVIEGDEESEEEDGGVLLSIDAAELVGVTPAHYFGSNVDVPENTSATPDGGSERDVYLTHEPTRLFYVYGDGILNEERFIHSYMGQQFRMKRGPFEGIASYGELFEPHPDAVAPGVKMFNLAELTQTIVGAVVGYHPFNGITTAVRRSYPAHGDEPAGVVWLFNEPLLPIIECPEDEEEEEE